ncbi:TspO and MBR related proteins [Limimonas halophila]|uniref:TspO and MBR related proteins n=1 Tax=Limimonas halophila TaxID=1082479 RepID=A0A1G7LBC6_9PROT|nr:TspO/MBR family protein [Limimonas halophila]SDF46711.1 TspO and MBR related proteins [Limimonas halophila]
MTATATQTAPARPGAAVQAGVLLLFLAICVGVEWSASVVTRPAVEGWYQALPKPAWTPPDIAFPIVWTILYVLMAVAAWLAWRAAPRLSHWPLAIFGVQLALNAAWSYVFFGFGWIAGGFVVILALALAIAATIVAFSRVSRTAAWLLVPYQLWVLYAATLNGGIVQLAA